jgi:hypothetical protein
MSAAIAIKSFWFSFAMKLVNFDESGRQAHLNGRVAAALMAKASDLLAQPPVIEKIDVLAAKLP